MNAEIEQGLRGTCSSCPFNDGLTDEASQAQNYGCLPTSHDIVVMKRATGQNWACHDDEAKVCAGLCHSAKDAALDLSVGGLVRYSAWYRAGAEAAISEARTGYLVQSQTGHYFDLSHEGYSWTGGARQEPTHHHPALKYWYPRNALESLHRKEDTRFFFSASTPPALDPTLKVRLSTYVALLEIETSPYDSEEVWLKYLTVDPAHQRKGLALELLRRCIDHVRKTGQRLQVSRPSEEGQAKLQAALVRELNASGIRWSQGT